MIFVTHDFFCISHLLAINNYRYLKIVIVLQFYISLNQLGVLREFSMIRNISRRTPTVAKELQNGKQSLHHLITCSLRNPNIFFKTINIANVCFNNQLFIPHIAKKNYLLLERAYSPSNHIYPRQRSIRIKACRL